MKRKNQPFKEIIDLKSEYKDYKALCRNESSKYDYYDDWRDYLLNDVFSKIPEKHINNFKHFLSYHSYWEGISVNILLSTLIALVPLIINITYSEAQKQNIIAMTLSVLMAAWLIIWNYFSSMSYAKFIGDLLEVYEIFEKQRCCAAVT